MTEIDETCEGLREKLRDLYRSKWDGLIDAVGKRADIDCASLGGPFLMDIFPGYMRVKTKVMIVGQQTAGWEQAWGQPAPDGVTTLMKAYDDFRLGRCYPPSPFWGAAWQISRVVNPGGPDEGFLWTNLIKVDQDEGPATWPIKELILRCFPVLSEELRITQPHMVIFFTGPDYDQWLAAALRGVKFAEVSGFHANMFVRVCHESLPTDSYRTYHPGYITRRRNEKFMQEFYCEVLRFLEQASLS